MGASLEIFWRGELGEEVDFALAGRGWGWEFEDGLRVGLNVPRSATCCGVGFRVGAGGNGKGARFDRPGWRNWQTRQT